VTGYYGNYADFDILPFSLLSLFVLNPDYAMLTVLSALHNLGLKTEKLVYLVLSILAILFILFEIVDLIYIFCKEVSKFSFQSDRPLGLTGVPIFFNILITLEIVVTFKSHQFTK
jgi:hypothetical protein